MTALAVRQTATAIRSGNSAGFIAVGGTAPYTYSVAPGGAGGTIDADGVYTAPDIAVFEVDFAIDTIVATDSAAATASAVIVVGSPLFLMSDIIQREMGLANGRVNLWNQKFMKPSDNGIYIVLAMAESKPFGNVNRHSSDGGDLISEQYICMSSTIDINIYSRGPGARDRKDEILLALASDYSIQQQDANGFSIARLPMGGRFLNLSEVDGMAIPYRFRCSVNMTYFYKKVAPVSYFDTLGDFTVVTDPKTGPGYNLISGGSLSKLPTDRIVAGNLSTNYPDRIIAGGAADA